MEARRESVGVKKETRERSHEGVSASELPHACAKEEQEVDDEFQPLDASRVRSDPA